MLSYVFIYGDDLGTREELIAFFDQLPGVNYWRYDLPHSFYVVAELTAENLAHSCNGRFGGRGYFLFVEYQPRNSEGWLSLATWTILNEHRLLATSKGGTGLLEAPKK